MSNTQHRVSISKSDMTSTFVHKACINDIENRRDNHEWTIQRHKQYWTQDTEQRQTHPNKHNTGS